MLKREEKEKKAKIDYVEYIFLDVFSKEFINISIVHMHSPCNDKYLVNFTSHNKQGDG